MLPQICPGFILARFLLIQRRGLGGRGLLFIVSMVYTCKVSTNTEERIRRKRVTVYSKYGLYLQGFYLYRGED